MQYDASASTQTASPGRLIYLMGPSGAGKDSLIEAARPVLESRGVWIVRRVITRSAEAVGEEANSVSPQQFETLLLNAAFALYWRANGLSYGIPSEIDSWLAQGRNVLVNGSRAHLEQAQERYPNLLPILLTVDSQVLRQRLVARGRESAAEIEQRLKRNAQIAEVVGGGVVTLDNSARLQDALLRFVQVLEREGVLLGS
ncbi:phosphonate metabolism protein/1,5-bisphosphokinase (PRPP-forming) PhnN [Pseudomonas fontis]|uniref:Ribose 1,5-bisphosphate phosphokinase PhnN n=1 Tax=Pseudomonas fontis TaxID=2942633 RepID=A0ABT5NR05_9PSED|nr:phosphonate metabolism protein/1,5-bisphosphokinase (PRPP-forming) PhnN [Pseudomonas fontis]MDD0972617.1 phosphonate metabolism protein/1,5-bisphosphokinase (PRPP-forming) PhnN [Pseudomonas fontis]MDD0990579.1 phosphonate metabolism protein/1,5-bisphosphokinase (PRPP-forming) PhnN [Pseudomonas fontis]